MSLLRSLYNASKKILAQTSEPVGWPVRWPKPSGLRADYEGASHGRRTVGWQPSNASVNSVVIGSSETLRARSRDMIRKNPWAANATDAFVANTISTGIKPQSQHENSSVKQAIHEAWLAWTDESDADGVTDFYGQQALATRAVFEAGECFVRLRYRYASDGLTVPLQLQILEAEHVPVNKNEDLPDGNRIRCGIEFDKIGRRVAYHVYPEHPGSGALAMNADVTTTKRIDAREIIHIYRVLRPGQLRGVPWLTQVLIKLYEIDQFDDATLVAQKIAAMFAGFITETNPEDPMIPKGTVSGDSPFEASAPVPAPPDGIEFGGLEPGTMQKLMPGEDVKFSTPPGTAATYPEFMRTQLRAIAAGIGITYEQLTGDLSGVNYSSIRAGLLEFRRRAEQFQHQTLVFQFCRRVWAAWIEQAMLAGAIPIGPRAKMHRVKWIAPGWPWVDPLKDMTAQRLAVRSGFTSRAATVSATGEDVEQVDAEQKQDNDRADRLGLSYDSDSRKNVDSGDMPKDDIPANATDRTEPSGADEKIDKLLLAINEVLDNREAA